MLLEFRLPLIIPQMTGATIECLHADVGAHLKMGSKFFDLSVDLGSAFAQECPPISYYRLVMREAAWLRQLDGAAGQFIENAALIALFSTDPDEPLTASPGRSIRTATAGIMHHSAMWSGAL